VQLLEVWLDLEDWRLGRLRHWHGRRDRWTNVWKNPKTTNGHQCVNTNLGDQGSMLWSQFLPIFGEKMAIFSKSNVMLKFLPNLALFWAKTPIFSPIFLGEDI
jgi:hypothetical protein